MVLDWCACIQQAEQQRVLMERQEELRLFEAEQRREQLVLQRQQRLELQQRRKTAVPGAAGGGGSGSGSGSGSVGSGASSATSKSEVKAVPAPNLEPNAAACAYALKFGLTLSGVFPLLVRVNRKPVLLTRDDDPTKRSVTCVCIVCIVCIGSFMENLCLV